MQYHSLEKKKLKQAETEQLVSMWLESSSADEFKLKVAAAGLKTSLIDRYAFWTYKSMVEHQALYWILNGLAVGALIAAEIAAAVLLNKPWLVVPETFGGAFALCLYYSAIGKIHEKIDYAENGPRIYM